jgi:hypothetical protein
VKRELEFLSLAAGQVSAMSRSDEQAAKNESTFRRANESLEDEATDLGFDDEPTPYLCECEDERCLELVRLNREEFEAVRANPKRFVMVPGHQEADDVVIREGARFMVIEKTGQEGDLVAEQDPRSAKA